MLLNINDIVYAISCKELKTKKKINEFMEKSYKSSPLLQKNVSLTLILDSCEGKACKAKKKRAAEKEILHILKYKNKRRIYAQKGPNAPRCVIKRGGRRFICSSCSKVSNENCRSFPSDESTIFPGTNIDSADFTLTSKFGEDTKCSKLKNPNFFKIVTQVKEQSGDSAGNYNKVVSFYDKKKGVPILMNFYAEKVLRKVYRFYPKYYVKVGGQWFSSVMRVRTTLGSEKRFIFETLSHVDKKKGRLKLYLNITEDPDLKNVPPESLFSTD
tara:strand:- start:4533 stop:5345 length:813 start_codon:yes stop_codon:yes gene_type:complete